MWPNTKLTGLLGCKLPIVQAPMAGANGSEMAVAVSSVGGLGFLPCAMLSVDAARREIEAITQRTVAPYGLNFLCHTSEMLEDQASEQWQARLAPYYKELGVAPASAPASGGRAPFDEAMCELVESCAPQAVSFHFGLPEEALLARVKSAGSVVLSSATTVAEARWLAERGVDAVIAQGFEAGGHRGMFLEPNINTQVGTFALVPQVVDAVDVPVIAAGGISDGRGIAAAFALGAAGVQIGTAYLRTTQALTSQLHRRELESAMAESTALTNLFSGKPARGVLNRLMREIGPLSSDAPPFPHAGHALLPLKKQAEGEGLSDFTSLWAGQAASLASGLPDDAGELTEALAEEALRIMAGLASGPR